jgi:hypothetical protein
MYWYRIELHFPRRREFPPIAPGIPPEVSKLINEARYLASKAGSPPDFALFMGAYSDLDHQWFYIPPTGGKHCPQLIDRYDAQFVGRPKPMDLGVNVAGSIHALYYWFPEFDASKVIQEDCPKTIIYPTGYGED